MRILKLAIAPLIVKVIVGLPAAAFGNEKIPVEEALLPDISLFQLPFMLSDIVRVRPVVCAAPKYATNKLPLLTGEVYEMVLELTFGTETALA